MRVPEKDGAGFRRYGCWAGNPAGKRERPERCVVSVYQPHSRISCQCSRARGQGPDGLYCGQHAKKIAPVISNDENPGQDGRT